MLGWKSPAEAPRRNEVIICHGSIFFQEPSWDGETAEFASTNQHAEIIEVYSGMLLPRLGKWRSEGFLETRY